MKNKNPHCGYQLYLSSMIIVSTHVPFGALLDVCVFHALLQSVAHRYSQVGATPYIFMSVPTSVFRTRVSYLKLYNNVVSVFGWLWPYLVRLCTILLKNHIRMLTTEPCPYM